MRNSTLDAQIEYYDLLKQIKAEPDYWKQFALWDTKTVRYQDRVYQLRWYTVPEYDFSPYGRTYYQIADDFGRPVSGGKTPEEAWTMLPYCLRGVS